MAAMLSGISAEVLKTDDSISFNSINPMAGGEQFADEIRKMVFKYSLNGINIKSSEDERWVWISGVGLGKFTEQINLLKNEMSLPKYKTMMDELRKGSPDPTTTSNAQLVSVNSPIELNDSPEISKIPVMAGSEAASHEEYEGAVPQGTTANSDPAYDNPPSFPGDSIDLSGQRIDAPAENSRNQKTEREQFETFTLSDRKRIVQVGDIRLQLTKTDVSQKQCDIRILADGNTIEKKEVKINDPLRIFVGSGRVEYEVFINWVRRDSAGGYARIR